LGRDGQEQAGGEERRAKSRRRSRHEVCFAAAGEHAAAAANSKGATLRFLHEHDADQSSGNHEVDNEEYGGHRSRPSGWISLDEKRAL
jgi:hypothetical protein